MTPHKTREGTTVPLEGSLLLVLVCFLWGANVVSIRISNQGIPPILAAALRSAIAAGLIFLYAAKKGEAVSFPRGERRHGMVIGFLFALDFLFLYWGIAFTTASRSIIFLYTHPFFVAIGAHFLLRGDRLTLSKIAGLILAFCGLLAVFAARSNDLPSRYWIGDLMEVAAAIFWAATTLYIKKMVQSRSVSHYQTLFAQLFYSIPVLALGSFLFERSCSIDLTMPVVLAFSYQCLLVAFFSYVLWFWMIGKYSVSRLTAFTFLSPLFGVLLGSLVLSEPVNTLVWFGLGLVGAGIYIVNRPVPGKEVVERRAL
ncbi:MAG: EamA/RhaT family transporter [Deltaproteobacteria bacterium HGW-Deltaproteobacteria-21]|nr:MAG: EamA/RhaT family transporter [Deltaproteobacteria bacterium HGW-Deltaproteobacteria-21]